MKNNLIHFLVLLIALCIVLPFTPWWMVYLLPFFIAFLFNKKERVTLWLSFLAAFVVWTGMSLFINIQNESILAMKIGSLFGGLPPMILVLISGSIGGIFAAFGGYLGQAIKNHISKKPNQV